MQTSIGLRPKEIADGALSELLWNGLSELCRPATNCRLRGGFRHIPTGFLLQGSKDRATGWKLVSGFLHEMEVMHPILFFDNLMDACIMGVGPGIGHGMRKLDPIHINRPSNPSCRSLMAGCRSRSAGHCSTGLGYGVMSLCNLHRLVPQGPAALVCHVKAYM